MGIDFDTRVDGKDDGLDSGTEVELSAEDRKLYRTGAARMLHWPVDRPDVQCAVSLPGDGSPHAARPIPIEKGSSIRT